MIYSFYGTNISESLKKARNLVNSLRKKKPDAAYDEMSSQNWNFSVLQGHLGGQGLFSSRYIIFLNRIMENLEARDQFSDLIPSMKESENIFILLEGKLLAEQKKLIEKFSEKTVLTDIAETGKSKKEFNIFSLADAVGSKDPVKLWIVFREAIRSGHEIESILGTLFWQVKSMVLAKKASSATETGLNPFVFSKSKRYAQNYSDTELDILMRELVVMYHEGHRGIHDLELVTEKMLLELK